MPLQSGSSQATIGRNISTERRAGKPERQAVAIAESEARRTARDAGSAYGNWAKNNAGALAAERAWKAREEDRLKSLKRQLINSKREVQELEAKKRLTSSEKKTLKELRSTIKNLENAPSAKDSREGNVWSDPPPGSRVSALEWGDLPEDEKLSAWRGYWDDAGTGGTGRFGGRAREFAEGGREELPMTANYRSEPRAEDGRSGRWGGRASDRAGARDDYKEENHRNFSIRKELRTRRDHLKESIAWLRGKRKLNPREHQDLKDHERELSAVLAALSKSDNLTETVPTVYTSV